MTSRSCARERLATVSPMTAERLQIDATTLAALLAAARAAWPDELAGLLGGQRTPDACTILAFEPCTTGSPHAFVVGAAEFAAAEARLRRAGHSFLGFVHSHPGGSPSPSRADLAAAWHDSLQVVLGGATPGELAARAFRVRHGAAQPLLLATNPPATTGAHR